MKENVVSLFVRPTAYKAQAHRYQAFSENHKTPPQIPQEISQENGFNRMNMNFLFGNFLQSPPKESPW